MKNKIFSIICAVLFGFGAFPQSQEIEYDTIIYFPSTILECPMLFDTAANRVFLNNGGYDTLTFGLVFTYLSYLWKIIRFEDTLQHGCTV